MAEMTNVFATNVGGTCAATQVIIISIQKWLFFQDLILNSSLFPLQAFLPLLRKSSLPRVLCISSFLGSISRYILPQYFLLPRHYLNVNISSIFSPSSAASQGKYFFLPRQHLKVNISSFLGCISRYIFPQYFLFPRQHI